MTWNDVGITEMEHVPLKRFIQRRKKEEVQSRRLDVALAILALAGAVILFAYLVERPHIGVETAHAAEPVHQNDYYCQLIKDGNMKVVGERGNLEALCAKWGVNLGV